MKAPGKTFRCPKCQAELPLDEAIATHVRADLEREYADRRADLERQLGTKQAQLAKERLDFDAERARLAAEREQLDAAVAAQVAAQVEARARAIRAEAEATATRRAAVDLDHARERLTAAEQERDAAKKEALAGLAAKAEAERRAQEMDLEVARRVDADRRRLEAEITARLGEETARREREKDLVIEGLRRTTDELKRRLEQGSQQTQGEAFELELESALRAAFPEDLVEPVPKGHRGADVVQRVRTPSGRSSGAICWEYKQTKNWNEKWIAKLKDDQRALKAELAVLVTASLPEGAAACAERDGVWVCTPPLALVAAAMLRRGLIEVGSARALEAGRASAADALYSYLTGPTFRQRLAALVEAAITMRADLEREKRALQASWERRAVQIERFLAGSQGLYGDVGGHLGSALPPVEQLELPLPEPEPEPE